MDKACPRCGDGMWQRPSKRRKQGYEWACKSCEQRRYREKVATKEGRERLNAQNREAYKRRYHSDDPQVRERTRGLAAARYQRRKAQMTAEDRKAKRIYDQNYQLQRMYSLSRREFDALLEKQGGVCAICRKQSRLHVDHCHDTGAIRGLLCQNCNLLLGHAKDSFLILIRAMSYLLGSTAHLVAAVLHDADAGAVDGGAPDASSDADPGLSGERPKT